MEAESRGAVAAVTSAHPGAGVTTVAAGLAFALAGDGAGAVALAEPAPTVPELALSLRLAPRQSLGELIRAPDRLDEAAVRDAAVRHDAGVDVLAYPPETLRPDPLDPAAGRSLVAALRAGYDWAVLDLGAGADPGAVELMRLADVVLLVVRPDAPGMRLARAYAKRLAGELPPDRVKPVANRYRRAGGLAWRKVQEGLTAPIAAWLPDDPRAVRKSVNLGRPVAEVGGRFARRCRELARLVQTAAPHP
jgi:Flp pilus assembly CpaE family ATPase